MFASSGRAQIAYEVSGEAGAADVLLIHAGVTDRRSWLHVVARLSPTHRCVAFDARGYGETTYEREDGWSAVADALAVLDAAQIDRAVIVACSMGAVTGIELALAHPERVSGLILIGAAISGAPFPEVESGPTAELAAQLEAAEASGAVDEVNRLEAWLWLDGPSALEGRVTGPARELFLDMNGRALRAEDPGDGQELAEAWPRLGEIVAPTLIMIGRLDVEDVQDADEGAAAQIPGARLRFLDGVAHLPHLEADPSTLDEISAFVDARA
jgi:pimeloyl-ACP methyl ester carboxylesterase